MSGHSKWSTIKRRKGKADAARGRIFTRLIREITIAARHGGGDPNGNPRLRAALTTAKQSNMPNDNIERAIRKGTGAEPGVTYEECTFEAYGPGGVGILVLVQTDNKNRTVGEVRHIFTKHGGRMGEPNSAARLFEEKGIITVDKGKVDEDTLLALVLDAGAEDMKEEDGAFEISTAPGRFYAVRDALEGKQIAFESAEVARVPVTTVRLDGDDARKVLRLVEAVEEQEDVQKVFANFDIPDSVLEEISQ